ncbi:MAG TPA: ABC transporter permease [Spirochaetota bacterium]|nr:ABC transporter permease [Spirochaetota bacterium]HPL15810.1 ABC transporter permease [Spirochaetota bacterium]HQF06518.1 ABC transporter permease [Spirochaetota bacterium]HQH98103.1 ABC transporter permease [Spirochaetota bacterium]HQJ70753.1 ABC transporter permease [Spirochaetota bacterium]
MIELRNVSKTYDTGKVKVHALNNVSLTIEEGEFVAIMGHSGSGKSTMLNILGFLDKPDTGTYTLMGDDITKLNDDELSLIRNNIAGFVFQQFNLLPRMNSMENVGLPMIYGGKREFKTEAKDRLRQVMLSHREGHYPNELSGGEQQRVAIARALVNRPMIIFADEPTGNLDTKSEEEIIYLLEELNAEGITIVMVTHEMEIAEHAKRIIRMRDGKIISDENVGGNKTGGKRKSGLSIKDILGRKQSTFGTAEFSDYLRQAFSAIVMHKLRSLLSILGILIGVAAVISMLALGEGAKESIKQSMSSLGSNILTVRTGSHRQGPVALQAGLVTKLTLDDAKALAHLAEVKRVSPAVTGRGQVVYATKNWNTQIWGTGIDYASMKAAVPISGRFFTEDEIRSRQKVAVIGATVIKQLFGSVNPVGHTIKINRINFRIIGILPVKGTSFMFDQDDVIVIPVTTAMYRVLGKEYVDSIDVEVKDQAMIDELQDTIRNLIIKRHRLGQNDEDSFEIRDMSEIRDMMSQTTRTMSLLLSIVAAISLLVGGIGIMNIMLVSVKERIKEIGLRKAIGARRKDILVQFLIESSLLTLTGGLFGIILGTSISVLISFFAQWSVKVSISAIMLSTVVSVLIGIGFGLWPAVQASRLNPIEALRWE